jgi:hypothetical protein
MSNMSEITLDIAGHLFLQISWITAEGFTFNVTPLKKSNGDKFGGCENGAPFEMFYLQTMEWLAHRYVCCIACCTDFLEPHFSDFQFFKVKSKAIPVTCREGLYNYQMLRIPHCLDSWLTDGSKAVSLTHRPCSTLQKHFIFMCLVLISVRG